MNAHEVPALAQAMPARAFGKVGIMPTVYAHADESLCCNVAECSHVHLHAHEGGVTMIDLTLADASHPAIVRAALDAALVSGDPMPAVWFGDGAPNTITARLDRSGMWTVNRWIASGAIADVTDVNLTTEQAVAAIVAAKVHNLINHHEN